MERPLLVCDYSHLFRGVRLRGWASSGYQPLQPAAVVLSFSDGVDVDGELLVDRDPNELVLAVPAYRTATGHAVPTAVWAVAETQTGDEGDLVVIKIGQRLN